MTVLSVTLDLMTVRGVAFRRMPVSSVILPPMASISVMIFGEKFPFNLIDLGE